MRSIIWILILAVCILGLASTVSAEETDLDQINGTLQNLTAASSHFQAGIQQISGDVNISNATTTLDDARTVVDEFILAFNDLILVVNRILGLVTDIQAALGNLSVT
jgi:peptidoglycan hydrolase CwlO-like protein